MVVGVGQCETARTGRAGGDDGSPSLWPLWDDFLSKADAELEAGFLGFAVTTLIANGLRRRQEANGRSGSRPDVAETHRRG